MRFQKANRPNAAQRSQEEAFHRTGNSSALKDTAGLVPTSTELLANPALPATYGILPKYTILFVRIQKRLQNQTRTVWHRDNAGRSVLAVKTESLSARLPFAHHLHIRLTPLTAQSTF